MKTRTSHAVVRAGRRYGKHRPSARALVVALRASVEDGTAKLRRQYRDGLARWEAYVHGRRVRFVYDLGSRTVVTVLPPRGVKRQVKPIPGTELREREKVTEEET